MSKDQTLQEVDVDCSEPSQLKFVLDSGAPDYSKIQAEDLVEITAILLTASYKGQEFFRVGYYLCNLYEDPVLLENPPEKPIMEKLVRCKLVQEPRVTRFQIDWGETASNENVNQTNAPLPENTMEKGTQNMVRQDMMSAANIAQAAQSLNAGMTSGPGIGDFQ